MAAWGCSSVELDFHIELEGIRCYLHRPSALSVGQPSVSPWKVKELKLGSSFFVFPSSSTILLTRSNPHFPHLHVLPDSVLRKFSIRPRRRIG